MNYLMVLPVQEIFKEGELWLTVLPVLQDTEMGNRAAVFSGLHYIRTLLSEANTGQKLVFRCFRLYLIFF